jgi:hypothetical protein
MRDTEKELIEFDVIDKMGGVVTTRGWSWHLSEWEFDAMVGS